VVTKSGWVWVNPYMSLVLAYEKLIGGRGKELHEGDPVPPVPDKPPVILHPPVTAATPGTTATKTETAEPRKPLVKRVREKVRKFIRRHRHRKPRTETDE
jgi:hypothetical protein